MRPLRALGALLVALALLPVPSAAAAPQYDPPYLYLVYDDSLRPVMLASCRLLPECVAPTGYKVAPCPDRRHWACLYVSTARTPREAPLRSRLGAARRT